MLHMCLHDRTLDSGPIKVLRNIPAGEWDECLAWPSVMLPLWSVPSYPIFAFLQCRSAPQLYPETACIASEERGRGRSSDSDPLS
jgi:hypothetical protein